MPRAGHTRLWVLVTDGRRARIVVPLAQEGHFHTLLALGVAEHPYCPPPLRSELSAGPHGQFTADVAHRLNEAADQDEFDRLILVAPRELVEEIQHVLEPVARTRVAIALDHDLATLDDVALSARLARWWLAPDPSHDDRGETAGDALTT